MSKTDLSTTEGEKHGTQQPPSYSAISSRRRAFILTIITLAGLMGPLTGNIYIPLLPDFQKVFNVLTTTINGTVSVFMIVFGFAPLIWAPFSDYGGRKTLYIISLLLFIAANVILAAIPAHIATLYIFRILQAIGASSVISVGTGTVVDLYEPKRRGRAISTFMLGPQLGPVLGPVLSLIALNNQWRWIFGFSALLGAVVYCLILFFLPETLRYLVGNGEYLNQLWLVRPRLVQKKIVPESKLYPRPPKPSLKVWLRILGFKPALLCSLNSGFIFASFYAMSVTFSQILKQQYNFKTYQTSLSYMCSGGSLIVGSVVAGHLSDHLRSLMNEKKYRPEFRLSIQIFGLIVSIIGILGYGWCVDKKVHVSTLYVFIFLGGAGMSWMFVLNTAYLTECATGQPATIVAIGNMMRNFAAAISSWIVDKLIIKMGFGWCFTGLAFLNLVSIAFIFLTMKYGPTWRYNYKKKMELKA